MNAYWNYTREGNVILANENRQRLTNGYFHSLSSARRWAKAKGFTSVKKELIGAEWTWANSEVA